MAKAWGDKWPQFFLLQCFKLQELAFEERVGHKLISHSRGTCWITGTVLLLRSVGDTCSQEAWTKGKDKYLGNFTSATLRFPQCCFVWNCNIFQHLLLIGQLMSPVLGLEGCDPKIVFLHIFLLRTWIFSELTLMGVPKKGDIVGNIVWIINLLEGLGKRGGRERHSWLCVQPEQWRDPFPGIKQCRSCLLLHL